MIIMASLKDIWLDDREYTIIHDVYTDRICNLSKVNIFVGANNTGKSRFLRSLFYMDKKYKLKFLPSDDLFDYYIQQSEYFKNDVLERRNSIYNSGERDALNNIYNNLVNIEFVMESETPLRDLARIFNINRSKSPNNRTWYDKIHDDFFNKLSFDDNLFKYNFYKIYIPSLRGLIPAIFESDVDESNIPEVFAERTKNDCFVENSNIVTDISDSLNKINEPKNAIIAGQKFYEYVRNYLLGDLNQRNIINQYETYLSETFFNGDGVVLIPKVNDDVLTVKIGQEEERPIYGLGDGIQSIILITLPLFLYLDKSKEVNTTILVFIEEPEVGLHPELQRKLLKTLLSPIFENYQFFVTTHSNHFIDRIFESEDISIYSFDKHIYDDEGSSTEFTIENVGFTHIPTLKRLGALPSSVLMDNCIIMVEGSTDKKHYKLYFDLYQDYLESKKPNFKRYSEGINYSFSIGGGSEAIESIKEFNDIEKERIFFILDSDSEEVTTKKVELFSELGYGNYYILNVKEVENLISVDSVIKTIQKVYNIPDRKMNLTFDENEYYDSKNFYNFTIETIFKNNKPQNFPDKKNKGKFKNQLAEKESEFVNSFEDLTDEAKNVAIKIYKFVKNNNPKV